MTAPAPIPALPDTERRTAYSITAQTGPFAVNFAVYGDGADYGEWIEVWLNSVQLAPGTWSLTSPSGPVSLLARPITDAVITLTTASTGTVEIVGARRPRRTSQLAENKGVSARDLNQIFTDIVAQLREMWDRTRSRMFSVPAGETITQLPTAALRSNKLFGFDGNGDRIMLAITPVGGLSVIQLTITRSQIPSVTLSLNTLMVSGYAAPGDLGAGAIYTSIGAGPGSPGAIQDLSGTWFGLVINGPANVGWFGAVADGGVGTGTDNHAAFTAALAASPSILVPPGKTGGYRLATPVTITSGNQIIGIGNMSTFEVSPNNCSTMYPDTCAFKSATPLTQLTSFVLTGCAFVGGTTQVDCGLMHAVTCRDCVFTKFTVAGFVIVRGEQHNLQTMFFVWGEGISSTYGLGFGYEASIFYSGGLYAGQNPAVFFGAPDAFADKVKMDNIRFTSFFGSAGWTTASFVSRILSSAAITNMFWFGQGNGNDGILIQNLVRIQACSFTDLVPDAINTTGTVRNFMVAPQVFDTTFNDIQPDFAGTNNFDKRFNFDFQQNVTYINCQALGDNATTFGFVIAAALSQTVCYVGCSGAFLHLSASALIRQTVSIFGCQFNPTNMLTGGNNFIDTGNLGHEFTMMADGSGALSAAGASVGFTWALGGGNFYKGVTINLTGVETAPILFAGLPSVPVMGMTAVVADSSVNTWGTILAGGGAFKVFVWYNGVHWTVMGI